MTERERAAEELASHPAVERDGEAFVVTTTAFDATLRVRESGAGSADEVAVEVRVPTIDAAVADETVAEVVREGWFETFERRLEDVGGVTRRDTSIPTARVEAGADEVVVETRLPADPPGVANDAKAVVDYVEGTFVEGLIPGYTYREPASSLLERARSAGDV